MRFEDLDLSHPILRAVAEAGYTTPTPIQAKAIPHILEGSDILGGAQTGGGKTAAFALPIIECLSSERPPRGPRRARALVLAPTRELATQIAECFQKYGKHTPLRGTTIYGGVGQRPQEAALRRGLDIIVATPGRLMDLMGQGLVDLSCVEFFVLDEADRMLDMGFIHDIRKIAAEVPEDRQTLFFSATMPRAIRALVGELLDDPAEVSVDPVSSAAPKIDQYVHHVMRDNKQDLLEEMLRANDIRKALVFTRTKHGADRVAKKLTRAGLNADAIHGNRSQAQRQRALEALRTGRSRVLVATDVAARGIDVSDITHVFNFDLPEEPESYIHRIGRTGRAGASGVAIAFCSKAERSYLKAIQRLTGSQITRLEGVLISNHAHDHRPARPEHTEARKTDHAKVTPKRKPRPDTRQDGRPGAQSNGKSFSNSGPKSGAKRGKGRGPRREEAVVAEARPARPRKRTTRSEIGLEPRTDGRKPSRGPNRGSGGGNSGPSRGPKRGPGGGPKSQQRKPKRRRY